MKRKGEQEVLEARENNVFEGKVIKINEEKDFALIEGDNGQRYYTKLSKIDEKERQQMYVGAEVSFETMLPVARNIKLT